MAPPPSFLPSFLPPFLRPLVPIARHQDRICSVDQWRRKEGRKEDDVESNEGGGDGGGGGTAMVICDQVGPTRSLTHSLTR